MDMLDRYLAEVQRNLPREHVPDIIDEIGDAIRSQIEERESALGRALTVDEQGAVLREYGNPKVVASRYAQQQYLIGPQLLPFYWYALRTTLAIVLGVEVVSATVASLVTGTMGPFLTSLDVAWHSVAYIFGIVTMAFALIERFGNRPLIERFDRWDPRKLPAAGAGAPVSRVKSGFEFSANAGMLLVMIYIARAPLGAFTSPFVPTNAIEPVLFALIASPAVVAVGAFIAYVQPALLKLQLIARVAGNAIVVVGIGLALRAGAPFTAKAGSIAAGKLVAVNTMIEISFVVCLIAIGIATATTLWKLVRVRYTISSASA